MLGLFIAAAVAAVGAYAAPIPAATSVASSPFIYSFNSPGVLNETGSMSESTSPYFWLNSGGQLIINNHVGSTIQGDEPQNSRWQKEYAQNNPYDTDGGLHPQNLFRLVTKSQWDNVAVQSQFLVIRDNFSASSNSNASNGLLLMSRYRDDGQTLYYAGVRVDGTAVIKKKYRGRYFTMAQEKLFDGIYVGDRDNVNLLPTHQWVGLRTETLTGQDGSVEVLLYLERNGETSWTKVLKANDHGQYDSTPPIVGPGYTGIRTDFMDVEFESFRVESV